MNPVLAAQAQQIITNYQDEIEAVKIQLVTNFDVPAQTIVNCFFRRNGINRFPNGNDLWEAMKALENGNDYEAPPADLIKRWSQL